MKIVFRWYNREDPVPLGYIRQIPLVEGVVTALYGITPGEVWPLEAILALKKEVEAAGLSLEVIESVPVREEIKLGAPGRDELIANFCQTIRHLGAAGIKVVCYNFMPVFDWMRTDLSFRGADGSTALAYDQTIIDAMKPEEGNLSLPGWDTAFSAAGLRQLLKQYETVDSEKLWDNLAYFLHQVIPVCEESGVKLAIHPDDPPWSIFGLPRIITGRESLERLCRLHPSNYNGITLCTGSLAAAPENDVVDMIYRFGAMGRIHFVHARNIKLGQAGPHSFVETAHPSAYGSLDMYAVVKALHDVGVNFYIRPDHGRMIWGEEGRSRPGYGLYDRALGAVYLGGLWEAVSKAMMSCGSGSDD